MTPSEDRVLNKLREEKVSEAVARIEAFLSHLETRPNSLIHNNGKTLSREDLKTLIAAWNRRADPLVEELRGALKPFADWAGDNVDFDAGYYLWNGLGCEKERINVWFGPSDFGRAREALALPVGGGSSREPAQASQVSSDPTANADGLIERLKRSAEWRRKHRVGAAAGYCTADDMDLAATLLAVLPHPDTSRYVDGAEENARLRQALQELDAVLGGTPMPNCATMNRLIKASANARAALSHPEGQSALVDAARAMADDYQTSPNHHPQHVLVPLAAFEAMRAALAQPDPLTETSGRVDGSSVAESTGAGPDGPGACDAQRQSEGGAS